MAIVPSRSANPLCIWAAVAMFAAAPAQALAETQVRGSLGAITVQAENSSVEEILTALNRTFNIHYLSSAPLDRRKSGTFAGSVSQVMSRVLEGYNFVLKTESGNTVVTVLGPSNAGPGMPAVVVPPSATGTPPAGAADQPSMLTPVLPSSAPAPAPFPERRQSAVPAPAPPVAGPVAIPVPRPGPGAPVPPFATGTPVHPAGANE